MPETSTGRTALVTGGSRGIGRAIAERLASEGATVALTFNASKDGAAQTVAAIEAAGGSAFAVQADLRDAESIPSLFDEIDAEFSRRLGSKTLDFLVNNAGNAAWSSLGEATSEEWDTIFAVHARAPFFVVQAALSRMTEGGRIINISSGASTRPLQAAPIYSMAKASVNNLTHVLAMELGPRGITVNAVAPGWVRTDMNAALRTMDDAVAEIEADTALGRFGETQDIAAVVSFLTSDEGGWITSQIIEASGGYKL